MSDIRKTMSLCPQHDVLIDNLTVMEHMQFMNKVSTHYTAHRTPHTAHRTSHTAPHRTAHTHIFIIYNLHTRTHTFINIVYT